MWRVTSCFCFSDTWAKYFVLLRKRMKFQGSATWCASQPTSFSPLPPPLAIPHRISTQDKSQRRKATAIASKTTAQLRVSVARRCERRGSTACLTYYSACRRSCGRSRLKRQTHAQPEYYLHRTIIYKAPTASSSRRVLAAIRCMCSTLLRYDTLAPGHCAHTSALSLQKDKGFGFVINREIQPPVDRAITIAHSDNRRRGSATRSERRNIVVQAEWSWYRNAYNARDSNACHGGAVVSQFADRRK